MPRFDNLETDSVLNNMTQQEVPTYHKPEEEDRAKPPVGRDRIMSDRLIEQLDRIRRENIGGDEDEEESEEDITELGIDDFDMDEDDDEEEDELAVEAHSDNELVEEETTPISEDPITAMTRQAREVILSSEWTLTSMSTNISNIDGVTRTNMEFVRMPTTPRIGRRNDYRRRDNGHIQ